MTLEKKFEKIIEKPFEINELEKIADDYAIEFVEWKENSQYVRLIDGNWVSLIIDVNTILTSKELLEIFKKEKGYGGV